MQTPKASRSNSSETPRKISPRAVQQLKTTTVETARASSSNLGTRTPKNSSPKVIARGSPNSPASEKKRPSKISILESQISQLQEELKNTKEQLTSSESCKIQAEKNEFELKQQLLASSQELKESQNKLSELSLSEETHKIEIEKISKDKDEALRKAESTEIELEILRENLNETQSLVENMKEQLRDSKEAEAKSKAMVEETLSQLKSAKMALETLQLNSINRENAFDSLTSELDESRENVTLLEGLVKKLKAGEFMNIENEKNEKIAQLEAEVSVLKTALEHEKIKYNEERINSTLMINSLNETAEFTRSSFSVREAELEAALFKAKADVEELKSLLMDKEKEIQAISEENKCLNMKIERERELENEIEILKGNLMDKETESQNIDEENETLKMEIKRMEEAESEKERDREEREARAERVAEQLAAIQTANAEMEAELRKIKVQSDQWRKAAEVAAAMVVNYNDGKFVERTGSLDNSYMGRLESPYGGDIDDEMKKKNGNVLKKIGVLWKKPQK